MGIGLCANSHLEGTLAKLDEFGKSDAFKKSPSIFNLLKVEIADMSQCFTNGKFSTVRINYPFFLFSPRSVMRLRWRK